MIMGLNDSVMEKFNARISSSQRMWKADISVPMKIDILLIIGLKVSVIEKFNVSISSCSYDQIFWKADIQVHMI